MSATAEKLQFLLDLQENLGGCIPFDRWMQEALYHTKASATTLRTFANSEDVAILRLGPR